MLHLFLCCKLTLHTPSLRIHRKVESFTKRPYKTEIKYKIRKVALVEMTEDETHCIAHHKEHMGISLNMTEASFLAERNLMLKSMISDVYPMTFYSSQLENKSVSFHCNCSKTKCIIRIYK